MLKSINDMYFKEDIYIQIKKIKNGEVKPTKDEIKNFIHEIKNETTGLTGCDKKQMIDELNNFLKK